MAGKMFMSEINMEGGSITFKRTQFVLWMSVCASHVSPLCFLYIATLKKYWTAFFVLMEIPVERLLT